MFHVKHRRLKARRRIPRVHFRFLPRVAVELAGVVVPSVARVVVAAAVPWGTCGRSAVRSTAGVEPLAAVSVSPEIPGRPVSAPALEGSWRGSIEGSSRVAPCGSAGDVTSPADPSTDPRGTCALAVPSAISAFWSSAVRSKRRGQVGSGWGRASSSDDSSSEIFGPSARSGGPIPGGHAMGSAGSFQGVCSSFGSRDVPAAPDPAASLAGVVSTADPGSPDGPGES